MQAQNAALKERVAQLEMQNASLLSQLVPSHCQFWTARLDISFLATDLLNLFCTLGETKRIANEEQGLMTEDVKALCSLCILLNARSMRVKGLQLMIRMMVTARGTSKQVLYVQKNH